MSIEIEVVNACKLKKDADDFVDRQDYLATLVRAVDRLPVDEFGELSDDAADWYNAAVKALNKKKHLPDFDVVDGVNGNDVDPEQAAETRKAVNAAMEETDAREDDSPGEDDNTTSAVAESVPGGGGEDTPDKKPQKARKAKAPKAPKEESVPRGPRLVGQDLAKDRFGVVLGTKAHDAVMMYNRPGGASVKEIEAAIGGRHRNILRTLAERGHRILKHADNKLEVVHIDDLGENAKDSGTQH